MAWEFFVSEARFLILETSGKEGQVALALGSTLLETRLLDEARRHARDLVPAIRDLLQKQNWKPADIDCVVVDRGPGSYTGLRVGIMSAKTFAFATSCTLIAVDTLLTIAVQAPEEVKLLDVFVDAQQDRVYRQRFVRDPSGSLNSLSNLEILAFGDWINLPDKPEWVSGPGLRGKESRIPVGIQIVDPGSWNPRPESLLRLGLARFLKGEKDDVLALEPLYLRPSAAEQQWDRRGT